MELIELAVVFVLVLVLTNIQPRIKGKKRRFPLSAVIFVGCILAAVFYRISLPRLGQLALKTILSWETLSVCLITYLITFLQRMMDRKHHLKQAQESLSAIFNSRRVNCTLAPILIGLMPSPAAAFIAGDIVESSCTDALNREEQAFVTSYYRHISESCLPTYSTVVLALSLSGVSTGSFLVAMCIPVIVLFLLGWVFYVRRIPKDTGLPPSEHKGKEAVRLFQALWAIILIVVLIIALDVPTWLAVLIAAVLYFLINRLKFSEVVPFIRSAFEWNIMLNTLVVMFFKNIIEESGVITLLPTALNKLPLPTALIFALVFFLGSVVAGSSAIVAMCIPMAYAAIPGGGTALMVLLMCSAYIAMQVAPVHLCLTLIAEHFQVSLGGIIRKTLPIILCFLPFLVLYYYLLLLIPGL